MGKLEQLFRKEIFDSGGNLIFKALAEKVFSSKKELRKLNRLMFPLIRNEIEKILNKNDKRKYVIIDAAVLFDCKLDQLCDYIILVTGSQKRRKLFLKNKGFSDHDIELRINGQHVKIYKNRVTFTIDNNNSEKSLLEKVEKIIKNI